MLAVFFTYINSNGDLSDRTRLSEKSDFSFSLTGVRMPRDLRSIH